MGACAREGKPVPARLQAAWDAEVAAECPMEGKEGVAERNGRLGAGLWWGLDVVSSNGRRSTPAMWIQFARIHLWVMRNAMRNWGRMKGMTVSPNSLMQCCDDDFTCEVRDTLVPLIPELEAVARVEL